jgi:hypothetical protein
MAVHVDGVGLLAPGLVGWRAARAILRGEARYEPGEMPRPSADLLPPAERRRCGDIVRLALHVGAEALAASGARAADLPTVFTSSSANGEVLHQTCETLAGPVRDVSPTRFHNSVHNAPAGYWSIATGSREPSTSLCAYQGSFAAGLLEAALQASAERRPVLLVAYDAPNPEPLATAVPIDGPCGVAMLLGHEASAASLARLELGLAADGEVTLLADRGLERLRTGNSAASGLPLLAVLAGGRAARVLLEYLPGLRVAAAVTPSARAAA